MRAVSSALVLLAGVILFSVGYVRGTWRGEEASVVITCFIGIGLGIFGFVTWLISFFGDRAGT
jgi:hypothetical protein